MSEVLILLGSNIGHRKKYLAQSLESIDREVGQIVNTSNIYETESWGFKSDPFLNQVILVKTKLNPFELLQKLQQIEKTLGRTRITNSYGARKIDIDILLYDDIVLNESSLKIPHPQMHKRAFTMIPVAEIAGKTIHPIIKESLLKISQQCTDKLKVNVFATCNYPG